MYLTIHAKNEREIDDSERELRGRFIRGGKRLETIPLTRYMSVVGEFLTIYGEETKETTKESDQVEGITICRRCEVTFTSYDPGQILDAALKGKLLQVRGLSEVVEAKRNIDEALKQMGGDV
jgi:hypothetical protein